jgi:hypothetical protein
MRYNALAEYLEAHTHGITRLPTVRRADQPGAMWIVAEVPLAQDRRCVEELLTT